MENDWSIHTIPTDHEGAVRRLRAILNLANVDEAIGEFEGGRWWADFFCPAGGPETHAVTCWVEHLPTFEADIWVHVHGERHVFLDPDEAVAFIRGLGL